jgi:hypothetical protein
MFFFFFLFSFLFNLTGSAVLLNVLFGMLLPLNGSVAANRGPSVFKDECTVFSTSSYRSFY